MAKMSDFPDHQIQGDATLPTLVYLPGLHGEWSFNFELRQAFKDRLRFVEVAYPKVDTWRLKDYPDNITRVLLDKGITAGWLLGESFGSQVAWAMLAHAEECQRTGQPHFRPQGLILAGGFVRYPLMSGVRLVRNSHRALPLRLLMWFLKCYLRLVRLRHRRSSAAQQGLNNHYEFHNKEAAKRAILSRYDVIIESDPRALARRTQMPVYYLTGFWDFVVMWWLVQPWLRRHCPSYRGWRLVWNSEHNVLGFQPRIAAAQILAWMNVNVSGGHDRT